MSSVGRGLGVTALVLGGALAIAVGVGLTLKSFKTIDTSKQCAAGASGKCLSHEPGIVQRADESSIRVGYGDGRSLEVTQQGNAYPPADTPVLIERWNGEVVAIVDRASERRYKTLDWPSQRQLIAGVFMFAVGVTLFVVLVSGRVRRRARAAAQRR